MSETDRRDEPASTDPAAARVAVVLSGAVARGAFQVGALGSVLSALKGHTPSLEPSIFIGTSAGAINAVLWARELNQLGTAADPVRVAEQVRDVWLSMDAEHVFTPLLSWSPRVMADSFIRLGWPAIRGFVRGGSGVTSLLDTTPLQHKAAELVPDALVLPPGIDAVGVVATWVPPADTSGAASGRSTLFVQERIPSGWTGSPVRALDVAAGDICHEHVLASCAVPIGFPAEEIRGGQDSGWYVDGGVRLNTPLLPAIALGATHIVVISAMSVGYADPVPGVAQPHLIDGASQVMHALIADRTVEDLLELQKTNLLISQAGAATLTTSDGRRAYREIPVIVVAPQPGKLRTLAQDCWNTKYSSLGALLRLEDNAVLGRLLRTAGDGASFYELLSYLLFDETYFKASYQAGVQAAGAVLNRPSLPGQTLPWRVHDVLHQPKR